MALLFAGRAIPGREQSFEMPTAHESPFEWNVERRHRLQERLACRFARAAAAPTMWTEW